MKSKDAQFDCVSAHVSSLSRRDFLRVSAVAVSLSATGLASVAPSTAFAQVPEGIVHISVDEYPIWHRLMLALLPTKGSTLVDPETLPVLQTVDGAFLATLPPAVLEGLKGGVAYFNEAAKEPFGKPFVDLSLDEASKYCDALASSEEIPARALFTALKFLIVTAYWAIPPTWEPVGFQGPVSEVWGLESQGNAPLPQA
ncbi:MAG: gluconate 2-dehydrogenase subunit 3 family protein [Granulosicoccus sp.]|nr:gluconate 2-dehydrogenase subunit 3 family protein [Granulosicoccus sp.]